MALKRLLSLFLAMLLTLSVGLPALGEENSEADSDYGITGMDVSGKTVQVDYFSSEDMTLVVQICADSDGDAGEVVSEKRTSAPATEEDTLNVTFSSLPEYFVVQAYLTGGGLQSGVYTLNLYCEFAQRILNSTMEDYEGETVVPLAGSGGTSSFMVMAEGALILRESEGYTLTAGVDGLTYYLSYQNTEAEQTLNGIGDGQALCFIDDSGSRQYRDDLFDGYDGEENNSDAYWEYTFLYVEDCAWGDNGLCITSDVESLEDSSDLFQIICLRGEADTVSKKGSKSFTKKLNISNTYFGMTGTLEMKIEYRAAIEARAGLPPWKASIELKVTYQLKDAAVAVHAKFNKVLFTPLEVAFPLIPALLSLNGGIDLELKADAEGEIQFQMSGVVGFTLCNTKGTDLSKKPTFKLDYVTVGGDVYIGLAPFVSIVAVKIVEAGFKVPFGVNLRVDLKGDEGGHGEETWHACETLKCLALKLTFQIAPAFYAKFCSKSVSWTVHTFSWPIANAHNSFTFKEFEWKDCSHLGYRVTVLAQDEDGKPLSDVTLSYTTVPDHYGEKANATTDSDGKGLLYLPNGTGYTVSGTYIHPAAGEITVSQENVAVAGKPIQVTLVFDHPTYTLHFEGNQKYPVSLLPEDMTAKAGEVVKIPTDSPYYSSCHFVGWSTDPNATVPQYAPGEKFTMPEGGATLYAIWNEIKVAFLKYSANGGTGAPDPVVWEFGTTIHLSSRVPSWTAHAFDGWRYGNGIYMPGEQILMDSTVVLMEAKWTAYYRITEGAGSIWKRTEGGDLRFACNGALKDFKELVVDGNVVDKSNYDLTEGSTIATLHQDYVSSLANGAHTLLFRYYDDESPAVTFKVVPKTTPHTGDSTQPLLLMACLGLSLLGVVVLLRKRGERAK